ncbi:energy-coupling factor transporter transmembrane protein EcfT [Clostridium estertheticum]|uniref:energy-coupling factor transporter transmembrane component T family protein n=1 Tax=Clostridium estertheticum TaxID=238834 RepID=UPI0013E90CCE|nr:energy-coupling factor transporter transmembrane component T [Clostridium estertheticum]MBZ9688414.1 energy-coupling factor transporter transmembrane protein EcfT [Clostridium estertheticum]
MQNKNSKIHVITAALIGINLLIITFLCKNPILLLLIFMFCAFTLVYSGNIEKLKNGFRYFVPFSILAIVVNMIFVAQGNTTLFYLFGEKFTLEALLYGVILSFKLLVVIYLFAVAGIIIDSDVAASYFSSKIPKSTLTIMISLKIFPNMKNRIVNLKEVYSIRGVDFESKKLKQRIKSNIPVLSVLLEDSLEGAFDIGEAAYVRGFLSGERSVYDKPKLQIKDYLLIGASIVTLLFYLILNIRGIDNFDIYMKVSFSQLINYWILGVIILLIIIATMLIEVLKNNAIGRKSNVIHRN